MFQTNPLRRSVSYVISEKKLKMDGIPEKWDSGTRDPSPGTETHRRDPGPLRGTRDLGPFLKHSHAYISYMSYERLHEEEQCLLEMTPSRAKLRLKSPPQKYNS